MLVNDEEKFLMYLRDLGLLNRETQCSTCRNLMIEQNGKRAILGKGWRCRKCRSMKTILHNFIFENIKIPEKYFFIIKLIIKNFFPLIPKLSQTILLLFIKNFSGILYLRITFCLILKR